MYKHPVVYIEIYNENANIPKTIEERVPEESIIENENVIESISEQDTNMDNDSSEQVINNNVEEADNDYQEDYSLSDYSSEEYQIVSDDEDLQNMTDDSVDEYEIEEDDEGDFTTYMLGMDALYNSNDNQLDESDDEIEEASPENGIIYE